MQLYIVAQPNKRDDSCVCGCREREREGMNHVCKPKIPQRIIALIVFHDAFHYILCAKLNRKKERRMRIIIFR